MHPINYITSLLNITANPNFSESRLYFKNPACLLKIKEILINTTLLPNPLNVFAASSQS